MDLKEIQGKSKFKKIDDYQTLETLGRGANGLVYKGLNTLTGSMVAIK
jgi:serine/threonine protein kinase